MGSSSSQVTLLRRIGGGPPQTVTDNGSGRALYDDNVEDNDDRLRGGGPSSIDDKDGQVGGVTGLKTTELGAPPPLQQWHLDRGMGVCINCSMAEY
jgi:hypothetical protein